MEPDHIDALVIGGGPAGLMAAEALAAQGRVVVVAEAKPTVGRKLLMAGKSGLNLTMDVAPDAFASAYPGAAAGSRRSSPGSVPPRCPPGPRRLGARSSPAPRAGCFPGR